MNKKSVAIVLANGVLGRGGIERIMLYVSRQIAVDAPNLRLIIQKSRWDLPGPLKHLSAPFGLAQFGWRLWRQRIGVAHINVAPRASTFRKMAFAALARAMGARVILHLHGSGYDAFLARLPAPVAEKVKRFFRKADAVIVLGSYWREFALTTLEVAPERLSVIENGVAASKELADPVHDVPLIAFMGLIGERKGVDILLDAFGILHARGIAFRAQLGGNGAVERFQSIARARGVGDLVQFLGWMDEAAVSRTLAAADLFVLPSRAENQPVAILEAMARGLPVVATRIGAIPETSTSSSCGGSCMISPGVSSARAVSCRLTMTWASQGASRWPA